MRIIVVEVAARRGENFPVRKLQGLVVGRFREVGEDVAGRAIG